MPGNFQAREVVEILGKLVLQGFDTDQILNLSLLPHKVIPVERIIPVTLLDLTPLQLVALVAAIGVEELETGTQC